VEATGAGGGGRWAQAAIEAIDAVAAMIKADRTTKREFNIGNCLLAARERLQRPPAYSIFQ
jgi:trans-aconitate methyltransferase